MMQREHLLSLPLKLSWLGWETNTARLQQAGWSLSAEQFADDWRDGANMRLALRHQQAQMYGMTSRIPFEPAYHMGPGEYAQYVQSINIPLVNMATRYHAQIIETALPRFQAIDAMPQFPATREIRSLEDFAHFATPLARTQEIIVDETDVGKMLERILELQNPARVERLKRELAADRTGMRFDAAPRQNFHAQILSIAA